MAVGLWINLGSSPSEVRLILAGWILALAVFSGWRWWLARHPLLLTEALAGLVAGAVLLFGGGLPLLAHRWVLGLYWIAVGVLELVSRCQGSSSVLLSPWAAVAALFLGIVATTFPGALVVQFTALGSVSAAAFGTLLLIQGFRLALSRADAEPPATPWRLLRIGFPAVLLALVVWGYAQVVANTAAADGRQRVLNPFYEIPSGLAPGEAGSLIRFEEVAVPDLEGRAYRVLFRSDDAFSRPTASSGLVFLPNGQGSNRPVIAWAHGTVGLGEICAPSRAESFLAHTTWINQALSAGFVVTAPDYAGAGGTGTGEKFMVLAEQGRDLVNSVRAAISLTESNAGTRYATYGESQGGAVSLAAGAMSGALAPHLELIGIGAVAAASDLAATLADKWDRPVATWLLGPHLVRAYTRYYPHLSADRILTESARNHYVEIADRSCVFDLLGALLNPQIGAFLTRDPTTDPDWLEALIANQAPDPPDGVPVFAGHGLADPLIDPAITAALVGRYCGAGASVTAHWMADVGHIGSSNAAAAPYLEWVGGLFAGGPAPSTCGEPLPVPPAPSS
jgi:hypothetical protein